MREANDDIDDRILPAQCRSQQTQSLETRRFADLTLFWIPSPNAEDNRVNKMQTKSPVPHL